MAEETDARWEDVTSHPLLEQAKFLKHVLWKNAETEYLQKYKLNGATDVHSFRERLPVSDYDSYKEHINRIFEGDMSPVLTADPVIEFFVSSGTSGGEQKKFPVTAEDLEFRRSALRLGASVVRRGLPGLDKGKLLRFLFSRKSSSSRVGVPCHSVSTSFIKKIVSGPASGPSSQSTSPNEVNLATDTSEALYCHLLLGLLQREEVVRLAAPFASVIVTAVRTLQNVWQEICEDIAHGTLSSRVKDETVRLAVLPLLRKDTELAEFLHNEFCSGKSSDGIIRRLWPNVKIIDTVCTGSMAAYLPAVASYSDKSVAICSLYYAASEGIFGVNLNPICPPEDIFYMLLPSCCYMEFIPVTVGNQKEVSPAVDDILDLVSLKVGQEYELLITTGSGLYRYRVGDILKVAGFYNATPIFQFRRRMNTVLSVDMDKTDENELHSAVSQATKVLERELGSRLLDYTSTVDLSSNPGHYVIFWELVHSSQDPSQEVLQQCCQAMEAAFNFTYRRGRHENVIGALELRLVQDGTFDLLVSHAIANGASLAQYKTPRGIGIKSAAILQILNSRVSHRAFSQQRPYFHA